MKFELPEMDSAYRLKIETLRNGEKQYSIQKFKITWDDGKVWKTIKTVWDEGVARDWLASYRSHEVVKTEYE